jgi:hypothetical protein
LDCERVMVFCGKVPDDVLQQFGVVVGELIAFERS